MWGSADGYMLGTPCIRGYSFMSYPTNTVGDMSSDNPNGAGNQQERPDFAEWIAGFTDGEGCFSIAVVRNAGCRLGWQVQHEFSITQAESSVDVLERVRSHMGCGRIVRNRRIDDHREPLTRYSVKRRDDLVSRIIPFFEAHPLLTAKRYDFELFRQAMDIVLQGRHLEEDGLREIASLTERMNRRARSRYLESSEAIRRPSRSASR
jgi:hypothetical protein